MPTFEIGERDFLLDGRPHRIVSGALHYFRIHPGLWADRIRKARLMGLNTIETYVPWNLHAPDPGTFDLTGRRDLGRFLDAVAAEGLHAIVRPGPYICAEWDGGGLPGWLETSGPAGMGVRRHDPRFLDAVDDYFGHLLPVVAGRQITGGGPVLMVQVENEYGAYPSVPDGEREKYLRALVERNRAHGIEVPLFTCDQAEDGMLERGGIPELHKTATFGSRSTERLAVLRRHQPTGPLMCMEFWNGWFDSWGLEHHRASAEANARDLDDLLALGASVNLYMFHGGTNFGLTSGANDKGIYRPITTSYDYDAPLSEHGAVTEKYRATREVIARHAPVPGEVPGPPPPAPVLDVPLVDRLSFADASAILAAPARYDRLPTMDEMRQWSGFAIYRTRVEADDAVLSVDEVRDRALVMLDGEPVGTLDRATGVRSVALPRRAGVAEVLVENQGGVNYGPRIGEPKGLIGPARTARRTITDWEAAPLDLGRAPELLGPRLATVPGSGPLAGPVFARGTFDSVAGADHHLRLDGWTKGLAWVNGELLGRYSSAGPTATLYVPGPIVRGRGNELLVFELHASATPLATFAAEPDLGPDEV